MSFKIRNLRHENALEIANNWKNPDIYSFYDMTKDIEDYNEFISPNLRGDGHYEILDNKMNLSGFLTVSEEDEGVLEIGLGMKPELTGNGQGEIFLRDILQYLKSEYDYSSIKLAVVSFNARAIKVYERVGFQIEKTFMMENNGKEYKFVSMRLNNRLNYRKILKNGRQK